MALLKRREQARAEAEAASEARRAKTVSEFQIRQAELDAVVDEIWAKKRAQMAEADAIGVPNRVVHAIEFPTGILWAPG